MVSQFSLSEQCSSATLSLWRERFRCAVQVLAQVLVLRRWEHCWLVLSSPMGELQLGAGSNEEQVVCSAGLNWAGLNWAGLNCAWSRGQVMAEMSWKNSANEVRVEVRPARHRPDLCLLVRCYWVQHYRDRRHWVHRRAIRDRATWCSHHSQFGPSR